MSESDGLAESVVNISEGRNRELIDVIARSAGDALIDLHTDPEHHRSVLTLAGTLDVAEEATREVVSRAVATIDLRSHAGVHPRMGAADVVPIVPLAGTGAAAALRIRNRLAEWMGASLLVPCFLYGPERTLPEVRRSAFTSLAPDTGPPAPHPSAGASAVGVRGVLVAYNVWIGPTGGAGGAVAVARSVAVSLRRPGIRTLGLPFGDGAQVSANLLEPDGAALAGFYDDVARAAGAAGSPVVRAELVGLVPAAVLDDIPRHRWAELDLSPERTIESRLSATR